MNKIEVFEVSSSFEDLPVLDRVSLSAAENRLVSIIGPSGCGKSTLFNIISGLVKPDGGTIYIDGEDYTGKLGRVSYMHQKDLLLPWRTIIDNVCIPLVIQGKSIRDARQKAAPYFSVFGLDGFQDKYPSQLSGGMRQRAALLRAYMFKSDIMLLDEPFGGLDAITKRKMQEWLMGVIRAIRSTILFITHDIDEAIFLSDSIYILSDRPARVRRVFEVDIERPRDNATFTSPKFNHFKKEILEYL
ncbi:MAG: Hydroxymethylpyrimidine ABC transporter, ATPase component [Firmicutes bacterium]|nr:Hydroxymethylpyrimidine ABC transporter, ATPase component [Bacillota bacterium]MDI6705040.1 ABC transporter ATP-binding protein [Bacillota bacterium]